MQSASCRCKYNGWRSGIGWLQLLLRSWRLGMFWTFLSPYLVVDSTGAQVASHFGPSSRSNSCVAQRPIIRMHIMVLSTLLAWFACCCFSSDSYCLPSSCRNSNAADTFSNPPEPMVTFVVESSAWTWGDRPKTRHDSIIRHQPPKRSTAMTRHQDRPTSWVPPFQNAFSVPSIPGYRTALCAKPSGREGAGDLDNLLANSFSSTLEH